METSTSAQLFIAHNIARVQGSILTGTLQSLFLTQQLSLPPNCMLYSWVVFFHLQVFVEFENAVQRCSWVQVYGDGVNALLVEDSIVWAHQSDSTGSAAAPASSTAWPALVSNAPGQLEELCVRQTGGGGGTFVVRWSIYQQHIPCCLGVCIGKNLAIRYVSRYRATIRYIAIYCDTVGTTIY